MKMLISQVERPGRSGKQTIFHAYARATQFPTQTEARREFICIYLAISLPFPEIRIYVFFAIASSLAAKQNLEPT